MDLSPVPFETVERSLRTGRFVRIDADLNHILAQLVKIDDRFRARFDEINEVFVLELHHRNPDGSTEESLVGIYDVWDERVVRRALEFTHPGYNFAAEAEKREAEDQRRHDAEQREKIGDVAERFNFALQQDLGRHENPRTLKSRAFFNKDET